jgi:hypothetical protein
MICESVSQELRTGFRRNGECPPVENDSKGLARAPAHAFFAAIALAFVARRRFSARHGT